MIRDSVTIMRGCFGGCTFCSITTHQGRIISSRSEGSVLREVKALAASPAFKGTVSDLGGPTANMYRMRCTKPEVEKVCRRLSCVHPTICKLLGTDHGPVIDLMRKARAVEGVNRVHIASGIRMDLARATRVPPRAGRAPRRRPPQGRARAHRSARARPDEEARGGGLRRLRAPVQAGVERGGQGAVPRARTSSPATRARRWRR